MFKIIESFYYQTTINSLILLFCSAMYKIKIISKLKVLFFYDLPIFFTEEYGIFKKWLPPIPDNDATKEVYKSKKENVVFKQWI